MREEDGLFQTIKLLCLPCTVGLKLEITSTITKKKNTHPCHTQFTLLLRPSIAKKVVELKIIFVTVQSHFSPVFFAAAIRFVHLFLSKECRWKSTYRNQSPDCLSLFLWWRKRQGNHILTKVMAAVKKLYIS